MKNVVIDHHRHGVINLDTTESQGNEAYIDGSAGPVLTMYGYYLLPEKETFIVKEAIKMTNNVTEWLALYTLILDLPEGWKGLVYSDSLLIVNQFNGEYQIKDLELKRIHDSSKVLYHQKNLSLKVVWVPRERNILGKKLERELEKEKRKRWMARNGK